MELTDEDIINNSFFYNKKDLLYNLSENNLSLRLVSKYQKLNAYMCAKYVVFGGNNEEYGDCCEDRWLSNYDILRLQPHLTIKDLVDAHNFVLNEETNERNELIMMYYEDKII